MTEFTAYAVLLFATVVLVSVFYWQIVHKALIQHLIYRMFARRDKLRKLAIDGHEDHRSFAYREVESMICKTIRVVPSIALPEFLKFCVSPDRHSQARVDLDHAREETSPELLEILTKTSKDAIVIMMLNSPMITVGALFFVGVLKLAGKLNKMMVLNKASSFVDELPATKSGHVMA